MTCYAAANTVEFALRSVMNQTYKNLEIFVIDDVSPDDGREIVKKLAAEDKRITLIQLEKNGGTYVAKNHGLQRATGTFVTCQDSDDWAHPQKIERMVKTLQDNPSLIATAVQHVRYDPARGFRGRNGYIQLDAPSLCYHRAPVMERVGYYDCVRAGADTEHEHRLHKAFGRDAIQYLPDLLTLFLWSETSLTGGGAFAIDDDLGIFNKPRSGYRKAHLTWIENSDDLYYSFPLAERFFDVPPEMKP